MQIKRKRSESELSHSSCSTASAFNSPLRPSCLSFDFSRMDVEHTSPLRHSMATAPHLPSRTLKRFRDNRPSEEQVHQRTINMLFSAAQKPQAQRDETPVQPQPYTVNARPTVPAPQQHTPQQSSLHNFWNLPKASCLSAASPPMASPPVDPSLYAPRDCEDCGQRLRGNDDAMDVDMDMDGLGAGEEDTGCAGCGKHVCSHCSITNMGETRRCLGCAVTSRKDWGGSIGWATGANGLGVC